MTEKLRSPTATVDPYLQPFSSGDLSLLARVWPVAFLLAISTTAIAFLWGRPTIDIDDVQPKIAPFRMDLNQATWPELALVPGVGERLAQRIVAHRERLGEFQSFAQLRDVHGIGDKLALRLEPFLLPLSEPTIREAKPQEE